MKKIYLFSILFLSIFSYGQNFGEFASGIRINNVIYNTSGIEPNKINSDPGALNFDGTSLGTFGQNSSCAKITAGEIKTFKNASANVCSTSINWRVYPASTSPSGSFNTISLNTATDCNTGTNVFNDGLGTCASGDQKWKDYAINIDFVNSLIPGNYILEIYYSYTGSDISTSTCETTKYISNSGLNYKAFFTISNPIASPTVSSTSVCEGDTLTLTANPSGGIAPYTFSWTGPNGYTSTTENSIINNVALSNSGTYSVIATDACGVNSTIQSTAAVIVNAKTNPEFDATLPAICKDGIAPLLSNTSTNGITGTWNPSVVSNQTTASYLFTPNPDQCANPLSFTVFVVNNVTPKFTLPASICLNETPPVLPNVSNNGIVGTWSPTMVSNIATETYTFTPSSLQCALPLTIQIIVNPLLAIFTPAVPPICSGEFLEDLPTTSNNGIKGTWSPAINNTATTTYAFTPDGGQCATTTTDMTIFVNPNIIPTFSFVTSICENDTAPLLPTTSDNGITGTWNTPTVSNTATGTYTFTSAGGQCTNPAPPITVTVKPYIIPTFSFVTSICENDTAPLLPTTSDNGITGTWNTLTVNNTATGTYTFTSAGGQCTNPAPPITVTVKPYITPTFSFVTSICENETAPLLPTTSDNGITGTWNTPTVSNTTTGTYTFTSAGGQCTNPAPPITVTVKPYVTPTFSFVTSICENDTAPLLPTISDNGITGTWNTPTISNTATGTYTFTSAGGQCTNPAPPITVTVKPYITPTFSFVTSICENDTAPLLPTTSDNGITGTWNTSTVSNTATGTYTFTSASGQCTNPAPPITVTVKPYIIPTFSFVTSICENDTAPLLPTTSNNGITGNWNTPTVSNTATGTYTFTSDGGQCTNPAPPITVTVKPYIIPTFTPIPNVCYDSASPSLPTISTNGISGTWNPSTVSNTASAVYTFTPTSGECVTTAKLNITVDTIIPVFNIVSSICANATAPLLSSASTNGITGIWNPVIVSNTASGTYTFTPDAGQCATTATLNVTINPILTPSFTPIASICSGAASPILPLTSNNGITGTWNPATVSNIASGEYFFTPNVGECAIATTLNVTVNPNVTPNFTAIAPICSGSTRPVLPAISTNSITGTWNPVTVSNTASGTYTFTPTDGQCALVTTMSIVVNQSPTDIVFTTTDVVNDGPDGIIEITGVTSGVAPFQYRINNGSFTSDTSYSGLLAGNYTITVRDSNGCEFNKAATINSLCVFPNAITPNNDTHNDYFNLKGCDVVKLELYNRYGVEINRYNNYSDQWDGTNDKGDSLPDGTYFYVAEKSDGTSKSGWVFVTR